MPSAEDHQKTITSNLAVINQLNGTSTPPYDWIVTVYFYASLHLVEKKFAPLNIHSTDHRDRNEKVRRLLSRIWVYYETLYLESKSARYDCVEITPGKARLAKSHMEAIQNLVNS